MAAATRTASPGPTTRRGCGGDCRRRRVRLVLSAPAARAARASARRSRRGFRQALGVPLQGPGRLVVEPASRPDRRGARLGQPTAWVPRSKPIWLTELGCPAVDKGPNQPNVFPDPKSSESGAALFLERRAIGPRACERFLEAHLSHWDAGAPASRRRHNPLSPVYGGRMVDASRLYAWAWDARPYPAFPLTRRPLVATATTGDSAIG